MKNKGELAPVQFGPLNSNADGLCERPCTPPETARRKREEETGRTQPETPRLLLSTVPFLGAHSVPLAILGVAIMITAWPGGHPQASHPPLQHEQGEAPKG